MQKLYPLKTQPVFKDYLWGGNNLSKKYNKANGGFLAESWELSCLEKAPVKIANGEFKDKFLKDIIADNKEKIMGKNGEGFKEFPLLFKFLDANKDLSVQVHPEGKDGKTEMWYIVDAKEGAKIGFGFKKSVSKKEVEKAAKDGSLQDIIEYYDVKKGDCFFIRGGSVHCLCAGLIVAEIQQSSDTTYRLYDYNRRDKDGNLRELHLDKALEVAKLEHYEKAYCNADGKDECTVAECEYFKVEKHSVHHKKSFDTLGESFNAIMFLESSGKISYSGGKTEDFSAGDTFLIPSCIGKYEILGDCDMLRCMLP